MYRLVLYMVGRRFPCARAEVRCTVHNCSEIVQLCTSFGYKEADLTLQTCGKQVAVCERKPAEGHSRAICTSSNRSAPATTHRSRRDRGAGKDAHAHGRGQSYRGGNVYSWRVWAAVCAHARVCAHCVGLVRTLALALACTVLYLILLFNVVAEPFAHPGSEVVHVVRIGDPCRSTHASKQGAAQQHEKESTSLARGRRSRQSPDSHTTGIG